MAKGSGSLVEKRPNIKKLREAAGLSQDELAKILGENGMSANRVYVTNVEAGLAASDERIEAIESILKELVKKRIKELSSYI